MKKNLPAILIKILLAGAELAFVGLLAYLRVLNIGWFLIIFGLLLVLWILFHLSLMTAFIATLRLSVIDIALYLAVHFFYLAAWLFQMDGGDDGNTSWTINTVFSNASLNTFLNQWGETLFWAMAIATFICYLLIILVVVLRLIQSLRARNKSTQPVAAGVA